MAIIHISYKWNTLLYNDWKKSLAFEEVDVEMVTIAETVRQQSVDNLEYKVREEDILELMSL